VEVAFMSLAERRIALRKNINEQLLELFQSVHQTGGMDPYPQPLKPAEKSLESELDRATKHTPFQLSRNETIHEKVITHPSKRFSLRISKSSIEHPEAGFGVHASGDVAPGTVVAIYAGTVHFPNTLTEAILKDNNYMFGRYDGVVIDGRNWEHQAFEMRRLKARLESVGQSMKEQSWLKFHNPFGIAQYINHPPAGKVPNTMCIAFNFPKDFPDELKPYIPNEYSQKPGILYNLNSNCYMRSVVCITTTHLRDEELLLNYRYNPAHPYPSWYTQPDQQEAQRRWQKSSFFSNPF
jgi:hypothetical protein